MSTSKFTITDGKGFFMPLANGYGVSVQFGRGNYADNYNERQREGESRERLDIRCGVAGSHTAECAVISPKGDLIDLPEEFGGGDQVTNRSAPAEVLALMNWAAGLPEGAPDLLRERDELRADKAELLDALKRLSWQAETTRFAGLKVSDAEQTALDLIAKHGGAQ